MKIPFSPPDITDEEIKEVTEVLKSGWITTGPKTKELERKIAEFCHTDRAVALNSATACMEMALRLFEIGPGDEVIVPAYTYTASASVVAHVGATIKLVDVGADSYHIDYDKLEELITDKTKAIIPVDIAGVMVDYDRIREILMDKKGLFKPQGKLQEALGHILILADSAHGFGASRKGKMSGEAADFTSFSFHAVKNFTTAEGGALVWRHIPGVDDEEIYHQLMPLTLHGQSKDALAKTKLGAWEYDILGTWYKCNMLDVCAAIGLRQFERYPELLAKRRSIIERYDAMSRELGVKYLSHYSETATSSGHLYFIRIPGADDKKRREIMVELAERGIPTNVHYKPLPMMTAYRQLGWDIKDFPNAYSYYENLITLPLHTLLSDEDVKYIIETVKEVVGKC